MSDNNPKSIDECILIRISAYNLFEVDIAETFQALGTAKKALEYKGNDYAKQTYWDITCTMDCIMDKYLEDNLAFDIEVYEGVTKHLGISDEDLTLDEYIENKSDYTKFYRIEIY